MGYMLSVCEHEVPSLRAVRQESLNVAGDPGIGVNTSGGACVLQCCASSCSSRLR